MRPRRGLAPALRSRALVAFIAVTAVAGLVLPQGPWGHVASPRAPVPVRADAAAPFSVPNAASASIPVHDSAVSIAPPSSALFPGPHPAAWGAAGVPPGGAVLPRLLSSSGPASDSGANWNNRFCAGLWPWSTSDRGGQSYYASGCYGHDEPGLQFYSDLPGSGGNVSWNFTLPTDRSATENQSNLYSAVWFGMTLVDPLAWMHQCFLELQLYPDDLFTNPDPVHPNWTVNGQWIGAAVAWQIETATTNETPCFYQPLYLGSATSGSGYFTMTEGDEMSITMTGWVDSPYGENLTIVDRTQGRSSFVTLWDAAGDFPLNPAYTANNFENGLQWTPGGEYPVGFAFEIGHAGNPVWPESNLYQGCSPGRPTVAHTNPDTPCPSYDASAWANDTLTPWQIAAPTFFNAATIDHPAQVAFTQDFGGVATLSSIGAGACDGQIGSAWCTYPWYSYSCLSHAFNFGAVDYPGVSDDFGQFYQFSQTMEFDGPEFAFFPPTNFSIPTCGQASYSVGLSVSGAPGGSVYFLSRDFTNGTVPGLSPGNYSIWPAPPAGAAFDHWATTGGATVSGSSRDPWATLDVLGDGSVTAVFTSVPPVTTLTFHSSGTSSAGGVVLSTGRLFTDGVPLATLGDGAAIGLPAGVYGIQGLPPVGAVFSDWSTAGGPVSVEARDFPYAWLTVTSAGGNASLTATFAPSTATASIELEVNGSGNLTFGTTTTNSTATATVTVGSYAITAVPDPGWQFSEWEYFSSVTMTDFTAAPHVAVENGPGSLYAYFVPVAVVVTVSLADSPAAGGMSSIGATFPIAGPATVPLAPGPTQLFAFPAAGYAFSGWSVSDPSEAWITGAGWNATVVINGSVTVTAFFVTASTGAIAFSIVPATAGFVNFNGGPYFDGDANGSVAAGTYLFAAYPFPGWQLAAVVAQGGVTGPLPGPLSSAVAFDGSSGSLTAYFTPVLIPISFAATAQVGVALSINGTTVPVGGTAWLAAGTYPVVLSYATVIESFRGFAASPGMVLADPNATTTSLTFSPFQAGTLVAILDGPLAVGSFTASPAAIDLGGSTTLTVVPHGGTGPYGFSYAALPPGCSGTGASITCVPSGVGTYSIGVTLSDIFALMAQATTTLVVNRLPSVATFAVAPSEIDVGMTTTFTTTVSGGTAPLAFAYGSLPLGCVTGDTATLRCTPTAASLSLVGVVVTDAFGHTATSAVELNVHPAPTLSPIAATRTALDVHLTTTLSATATGTGWTSFAWYGLPTGCASANLSSIDCVPTAVGVANITLVITDAVGGQANSTLVLTVAAAPSAAVSASPSPVDPGTTTWLNVTASGGTGGLSYAYAGLPVGCASMNVSSLACAATTPGTYTVTVTVTDALHQSANATATFVVNGAAGPGGLLSGVPSAVLALLVLAVVFLVAFLVVLTLRRRAPPPPTEPTADPSPTAPPTGGP